MTHLPTPGPLATTNLWVAASAAAGTKVLFLDDGPQDYPTGIAAAYEALVAALRAVADLAMHDPRTSAVPAANGLGRNSTSPSTSRVWPRITRPWRSGTGPSRPAQALPPEGGRTRTYRSGCAPSL